MNLARDQVCLGKRAMPANSKNPALLLLLALPLFLLLGISWYGLVGQLATKPIRRLPDSVPKKVEPPPAAVSTEIAKKTEDKITSVAAPPLLSSDQTPPSTEVKSELKSELKSEVKPEVNTSAGEPAPKPPVPHERFLILTPGGPVIVDLLITLQGAGYEAALAKLVDEAFRVADDDGDGKANWKSTVENPKFRSGQFGNLVADTDEEREQLMRLYDSDRDGLVDREELPRFLTRNSGGGQSFSLRSSNEYRSSNRARSPTRLLFDADRDGSITEAEMEAAPASLRNRDADDDEIVVLAEVKNAIDNPMAPAMILSNRRRTNEPDTAVWLTNRSVDVNRRWSMVQFLLQELYSYGESVRASDWPMTSELFQFLDTDGDGQLQRTELPKLLDTPAHLVIETLFDGVSPQERGPRIQLRRISSELSALKPNMRELPTRLSLQFPEVELEFFVNEDASLTNVEAVAKSQLMALDRDKNGYLEKSEVPAQIPGLDAPFEAFDADADGKVYEPELIAYLVQRGDVARAQVRARAADQEDALFTALDTDGDGRLNNREIRDVPALLKAMDRNQDGKLQSHEIPGSMVVGFVRGNPQQDDQLFSTPAVAAIPSKSSPPQWFRGMDANSDGEISAREFFGDLNQFRRLDRNEDGYLSPEEAAAVGETPKRAN